MSLRRLAPARALAAVLTGCSDASSYGAAETGLRDWLVAAHEGDQAACGRMTADYRRLLAAGTSADVPGSECDLVLAAVAGALPGLPSADAAMTVPAWDPSGEALVAVTGDDSETAQFWMQWDGERWLVAGREA